ncbi:hypothetical protein BKA61DRAFT_575228 [Leptodontidium sp. MPI-SDFR-AT-0119]|nr:hypothetical protein BKA61DRAFT_575228 [Leptodontidium sp. MPI-SDFR-AT-0119]
MDLESPVPSNENYARSFRATNMMPHRDNSHGHQPARARYKFIKAVEMIQRHSSKRAYSYAPIDSNNDTRILRIQAGTPDQKLFGTLVPGSQVLGKAGKLDRLGLRKRFSYDILQSADFEIAFSWPSFEDEVNIYYSIDTQRPTEHLGHLNNHGVLHISHALKQALIQIRHASEDVHIWCDQICINQNDEEEMYVEHERMEKIYNNARAIRVWMGSETPKSKETFDFLVRLLDPAKQLLIFQWGSQKMIGTDFIDALILARKTILGSVEIQTFAKSMGRGDLAHARVLEGLALQQQTWLSIRPGAVVESGTGSCDLPSTTKEAAEEMFLKLDWDDRKDGLTTARCVKWVWIHYSISILFLGFIASTVLRRWLKWPNGDKNQGGGTQKEKDYLAWVVWGIPFCIELGSWMPYELALLEEGIDLGRRENIIVMQNGSFQDLQAVTTGRPGEEMGRSAPVEDKVFVCVYKRINEEWRLRHVNMSRGQAVGTLRINQLGSEAIFSRQPSANQGMDRALFTAMRRKLLGQTHRPASQSAWRSLVWLVRAIEWPWRWSWTSPWAWLRHKFNPLAISGLQFWEFKLNPTPKLVDPIEKNKLPDEDDTSYLASHDWDYSELSGDDLIQFKGLLSGSYLLHLLKFPDHAKPDSPIWMGLPKKLRSKLVNDRNI